MFGTSEACREQLSADQATEAAWHGRQEQDSFRRQNKKGQMRFEIINNGVTHVWYALEE